MSSGTRHSRRRPGAPAVLRPASVRSRVLAAVLDTVLAAVLVGGTALGLMAVGRPVLVGTVGAGLGLGLLRQLVLALTGWTPGAGVARIRLVDARTGRPSALGVFLHADLTLVSVVPTLGLGAVALMRSASSDPQGRAWHDHFSGIKVVDATAGAEPAADPEGAQAQGGDDVFPTDAFSFSGQGRNTLDVAQVPLDSPEASQAIIDSVPWASVPMVLDEATEDSHAVLSQQEAAELRAQAAGGSREGQEREGQETESSEPQEDQEGPDAVGLPGQDAPAGAAPAPPRPAGAGAGAYGDLPDAGSAPSPPVPALSMVLMV